MKYRVVYAANLAVQRMPATYRTLHVAENAAREYRRRTDGRMLVWIEATDEPATYGAMSRAAAAVPYNY